jgi:hypothetical protein
MHWSRIWQCKGLENLGDFSGSGRNGPINNTNKKTVMEVLLKTGLLILLPHLRSLMFCTLMGAPSVAAEGKVQLEERFPALEEMDR